MKKIVIALCMLIITVLSMSCGSKKEQYSVLEYDYSDSISTVNHSIEYDFKDIESYKNFEPLKKFELNVQNKSVVGEYVKQQYNSINYFPVYRYIDENKNYFEVDSDGKLTLYFVGETKNGIACLNEKQCLDKAKEFISEFIDISDYKINVKDNKAIGCYEINFTRYIDEMKTTDCAKITIQYDGSIYSYSSFMFGKCSLIKYNPFDLEKSKHFVNEKMDNMYKETKKYYSNVEYNIIDTSLTVLKDGNVALLYDVEIKCTNVCGEYETTISDRVNLVVIDNG